MVFAHLVHTQLEPLLEFLCSLPGPTGKPALEFVMAEWTSRQHLFYGQYEGKVRWGLSPSPGLCPTGLYPSVLTCPAVPSALWGFIAELWPSCCPLEIPRRLLAQVGRLVLCWLETLLCPDSAQQVLLAASPLLTLYPGR